ncbi:MAG: ribosomal protein S18-alanine N-acetyltransferase [Pseudanabaena sp. ELA607]|jgi:ribosomal-protein-alanine N-acetyltransferase
MSSNNIASHLVPSLLEHDLRPLKLQPATQDHLAAIHALDQQCLGGMWSLNTYAQELANPKSRVLCLLRDTELLGFGCLWSILEEAHITLLAVAPAYQSQGLGRLLVWGLLHEARANQSEWATLEVRSHNQAALKIYQYFGFETVGQRHAYYPDGADASILWCKGLHQPEFSAKLDRWQQELQTKLAGSGWHIGF